MVANCIATETGCRDLVDDITLPGGPPPTTAPNSGRAGDLAGGTGYPSNPLIRGAGIAIGRSRHVWLAKNWKDVPLITTRAETRSWF